MADALGILGLNVNIDTFYETTIDGYKCYVAEYVIESEINMQQTLFMLGDGTDTYSVACTYFSDTDDETMNMLTNIVYSFDIT